MKTLEFKTWVVEYDDVLTKELFRDVVSGPESCGCGNCENFMAARSQVYPERFMELLSQLGIDPQKETELFQFYRIRPGKHYYSGWFHFVGRILEMPEGEDARVTELVPDFESFAWSFWNERDLVSEAFNGHPVVQLGWFAVVPWVLETEEPD